MLLVRVWIALDYVERCRAILVTMVPTGQNCTNVFIDVECYSAHTKCTINPKNNI